MSLTTKRNCAFACPASIVRNHVGTTPENGPDGNSVQERRRAMTRPSHIVRTINLFSATATSTGAAGSNTTIQNRIGDKSIKLRGSIPCPRQDACQSFVNFVKARKSVDSEGIKRPSLDEKMVSSCDAKTKEIFLLSICTHRK